MKDSITKHLIFVARKAQLRIGSRLSPFGITAAEEPFFMAIQHHAGATQEELTALVGVDKAATARALASLERKGFLTRRQDEKDRRQNRIYASPAALALGGRVHAELLDLNRELLDGISEEDQALLYRALQTVERNLTLQKS